MTRFVVNKSSLNLRFWSSFLDMLSHIWKIVNFSTTLIRVNNGSSQRAFVTSEVLTATDSREESISTFCIELLSVIIYHLTLHPPWHVSYEDLPFCHCWQSWTINSNLYWSIQFFWSLHLPSHKRIVFFRCFDWWQRTHKSCNFVN